MTDIRQTIHISPRPVDRASVAEFAARRGFVVLTDTAWTDTIRRTSWGDVEVGFSFGTHAMSGRGVFVVADRDTGLASDIASTFGLESPHATLHAARQTVTEAERIEAIYAVDSLLMYADGLASEIEAWLAEQLLDPRDLVRWAAAECLSSSTSEQVELAIADAAVRFRELRVHHQRVIENRRVATHAGVQDRSPAAEFVDDVLDDDTHDEELLEIVDLEPAPLVLDDEPDRVQLEALLVEARRSSQLGYSDDAIDAARRAAELAELAGFPDLVIEALHVQVLALANLGHTGLALETAERAMQLASAHANKKLVAETAQCHAVALWGAGQMDRASDAFARSIRLYREVFGDAHPRTATLYGQLAGLSAEMGNHERATELTRTGLDLVERYLNHAAPSEADYVEALFERAILANELAYCTADANDDEGAIELLHRTVSALEHLYGAGFELGRTVDAALTLASELAQTENDERFARCELIMQRLDDLMFDPHPDVRAEQQFWQGLRAVGDNLRSIGVSGEQYAEILVNTMHGEGLSETLLNSPVLAGFAKGLAQRIQKIPTLAVLAPLALDTALHDGDIDGALANLEGICVASVRGADLGV